jgi:hypothetical protein
MNKEGNLINFPLIWMINKKTREKLIYNAMHYKEMQLLAEDRGFYVEHYGGDCYKVLYCGEVIEILRYKKLKGFLSSILYGGQRVKYTGVEE